MDHIENLIRGLDPVRAEGRAHPEAGTVSDPGTDPVQGAASRVFSDDQDERGSTVVSMKRRRRWTVVAGAAAAAAAVAAAVVIGGNFGASSPLPADEPEPIATGLGTPSATPSGEPTPTTTVAAGSPLATYTPAGEGSDAALLTGRLVLDDGCLYIEAPGSPRVLPYFPNTDTSFADGMLSFFGTDYALGQEIALGGGGSSGSIPVDGTDGYYTPESCESDSQWIVSQVPPSAFEKPSPDPAPEPYLAAEMGISVVVPADWEIVEGAQGLDILSPSGEVVSNLQRSAEGGIGGACQEPAVPWQEVRSIPVSIDTAAGPVDAKFVLRVFTGERLVGTTALVLADDPTSGEGCMLYNVISNGEVGLLSLTNNFQLSPSGSGRVFASLADAEAYAGSAEFDALAAIADSIVITD
ncbi:hypothetical protein IWX64_002793 [Arthrobacter sp. CAN_A212]|uniref:hypothetical protein n=1 Tax=Arthrobacter sp. CAN_A212 TaxID=2787719 RepID=UPI0018CBC24C